MRISELIPGMQVKSPLTKDTYTFITQSKHPYYPGLSAVVWISSVTNEVMIDALAPEMKMQHLPLKGSPEQWRENVGRALGLIQ